MDIYETATAGHCLVAVDDRGRLVGVAQQVDLLASLAPPSDEMPATAGASAADRSPLEVGD